MRLIGLAAGACAVLVLAGCSEEVSGQPEVSGTPLTKEQLFDPCTVPESALVAAGVDPASKDDNPFSVPRPEWKGCTWRAGDHYLSLFSTVLSMERFRENGSLHGFEDISVDNRPAVQYLLDDKNPPEQCGVVFDTGQGRVTLQSSRALSSKTTADPCAVAIDATAHFTDVIPR